MKTPHTLPAALAAFAGLSLATLHAANPVPNYTPTFNSPVTALNIEAPFLDFDPAAQRLETYELNIAKIEAKVAALPVTNKDAAAGITSYTLVIPPPPNKKLPPANLYALAVANAAAVTDESAAEIVAAAIQFQGGAQLGAGVKAIMTQVAIQSPLKAEAAVAAVIAIAPLKAGDAAAGAILGVIASGPAATPDYGDLADDAIDDLTHALVERIAKAAVAATKKAVPPTSGDTAWVDVTKDITTKVMGENIKLYIDDLARGLIAGAKSVSPTAPKEVAHALLTTLAANEAYNHSTYISEAVSGALKPISLANYDAFVTDLLATPGVGEAYALQINAVAKGQKALRQAPFGQDLLAFDNAYAALPPQEKTQIASFLIGAIQGKTGKAHDFLNSLLNKEGVALDVAGRQELLAAAVRGKFAGSAKLVQTAIGTTNNKLSPTEAVQAAIPSAPNIFTGAITNAAVKLAVDESGAASTASAALTSAFDAGYSGAIPEIALQAYKGKKTGVSGILTSLLTNPKSAGWWEAITAQAIIFDKKNAAVYKAAAIAATSSSSNTHDKTAVILAADLALAAKTTPKTAYEDAINDFYKKFDLAGTPTNAEDDVAGADYAKAILFARAGVNVKLAGPLMAVALKLGNSSTLSDADLLKAAQSFNKKDPYLFELQFNVAKDALSQPDQLFDIIDHTVFTNASKYVGDITAAAVAARPEYAHYIARAAAFRAPAAAGKVGAAAITFAHMKSNRNLAGNPIENPDDPAAVAAITSATILGILDAKLPTTPRNKQESAVKMAVGQMVKAAILLDDGDGTGAPFRQSTGVTAESFVLAPARGTAGAVTGIVSQLQGNGTPAHALSPLAATAITSAIKAYKKDALAIVQAAATAAQWVYQYGHEHTSILDVLGSTFLTDFLAAVTAAGTLPNGQGDGGKIENAVRFGIAEAINNALGAGAAGILNYAHRSGLGSPVTDIANF